MNRNDSLENQPDRLRERYSKIVERYQISEALSVPEGIFTFAELNAQSEIIGNQLLESGCSECIIYEKPSLNYFASLIACMKVGIPAIPLDPEGMNREKTGLLTNFQDLVCLTSHQLFQEAKEHFEVQILVFNNRQEYATDNPVTYKKEITGLNTLHRVFTSGSTGSSKMVSINRDSEYIHVEEASRIYEYQPNEKYSNFFRHVKSSMINAFWRVILTGSCFVCLDLKKETSAEIYKKLCELHVKGIQGPSTIIGKFMDKWQSSDKLSDVNSLIFGGEPLNPTILKRASNLFKPETAVVFNYSSTETMLISAFKTTMKDLLKLKEIPVGLPVASKTLKLQDDQEIKAEMGEVVVTSKYIATDIHGDRSECRLIQTPGQPGYRTYYTGDLAKWNREGQLVHLGRLDDQFKINGVRIDVKAIERRLEEIDGIKESTVLPMKVYHSNKQLVAGLVWQGPALSNTEVYSMLSEQLPTSHIPAHLLEIEKTPINITGKKDVKKLKELFRMLVSKKLENRSNLPDRSQVENFLRNEWAKILNKSVDRSANSFFSEGGDSLAVTELISSINSEFELNIEPIWVFKYPGLSEQASYLNKVVSENGYEKTKKVSKQEKSDLDEIKDLLGW